MPKSMFCTTVFATGASECLLLFFIIVSSCALHYGYVAIIVDKQYMAHALHS